MAEGKAGFHNRSILDGASSNPSRKLERESSPLAQPPIQPFSMCPQCGSKKLYKDGLRYLSDSTSVQRWLCRQCSYRFTEEKPLQKKPNWQINTASALFSKRQVCDLLTEESKNLATVPRQETAQREGTIDKADVKGHLAVFTAKQLTMGLKEKTVKGRISVLELLHRRGANLFDPLSVFKATDKAKKYDRKERKLTDDDWSDGAKYQAADAYLRFCEILKIPIPPDVNFRKFKPNQKLPWLPLESEVDQLIAGCSRRVSSFLQLLKETGARCGEAWALNWIDIDVERGIVTINAPEKHGKPRQAKMSGKLTAMLNSLPRIDERVFGRKQLNYFRQAFMKQRARTAYKLQNPRINRITFHTFRHFFGTMEYHRTKDLLHVQQKLGHRSVLSTMLYTQLVDFESDDYHVKTAKNLREDEELISAGFEYVTEREDVKVYRKRK